MNAIQITQLKLESGDILSDVKIAYQTFGKLNEDRSNVIWVCHAISGDTDVLQWWSGLFGTNKLYDPESYFIICANCLGSPFGSTRPQDFTFPQITVRDQVTAYMHLAESLQIKKINTLIGGSFGGYQALEYAYTFEGEIENLILLASSARESAWGIAVHEAQRMALKADSTFGDTNGGQDGLKAARALAMLTYRTSNILINDQTETHNNQVDDFKASSYVNYQGDKFSQKFDSLCLYYLTKCIDSHNIGRKRGGESKALQKIKIPTLVIGFTSDLLVPIASQKYLAQHLPNALLTEIDSTYGHDGFLMESQKITQTIKNFYSTKASKHKRILLKFGGTSLYGEDQLKNVIKIIESEYRKSPLTLVVSARGKTTDKLTEIYNLAAQGMDYEDQLKSLITYSKHDIPIDYINKEIQELEQTLNAIHLLKIDTDKVRDKVLAFGELISAKAMSALLQQHGFSTAVIDARKCLFFNSIHGKIEINQSKSKAATLNIFKNYDAKTIPIITGFIASNDHNETITLGRNGSNYSASLFANFLQVSEVQNWTDVNGIYSADPAKVTQANKINNMTYHEANELASFGMGLLHSKTIIPLMKMNIPLRILSTKFPNEAGTVIDQHGGEKGIKAVTSVDDVALLTIEGSQLKESVGIDARIFSCLSAKKISVKMISQASTENGIGFVIAAMQTQIAHDALRLEFKQELNSNEINISTNSNIGIVSIIGRHNYALEKAISSLRKNGIWMYLISNSISGKNISLVVDKHLLDKAIALVHNEV